LENPTRFKICTIRSKIKNLLPTKNSCPRTRIRDSEWTKEILDSRLLRESVEIIESWNTCQNSNPKYLIVDFYVAKLVVNVVDGESVDENGTHLLTSIGIFCLFIKIVSNEKKT
jgi:hypothetical protein